LSSRGQLKEPEQQDRTAYQKHGRADGKQDSSDLGFHFFASSPSSLSSRIILLLQKNKAAMMQI
jgi:hypothetical protein